MTPKVKVITDAKLATLAEDYEALKLEAKEVDKDINRIKKTLLDELQRRGTHLIETNGWRIVRVQAEVVVPNYEALMAVLTPKQRRMVTKTVVDPKAVAAAVTQGLISSAIVDRHSQIKSNAPYPVVSKVAQ